MTSLLNFIQENVFMVLLVCLPLTYFILRDISVSLIQKERLKKHKEEFIASEKRIYELVKKSDQNKAELLNNLTKIREQTVRSVNELNDLMNENEKEKK